MSSLITDDFLLGHGDCFGTQIGISRTRQPGLLLDTILEFDGTLFHRILLDLAIWKRCGSLHSLEDVEARKSRCVIPGDSR